MAGLDWWQWLQGMNYMVQDFFLQRWRARRLPQQLPLPRLTNFTCIITGATSGIGLETSRQLAKAGAHVILAVRNTKEAEKMLQEWELEQKKTGGPCLSTEVMKLDLLSLASVRSFAEKWESRLAPLHCLINNAGIFAMGGRQKFSEDGYEHHIQVNYLGNALLTLLLLPSLRRGAPSRVVNVNSLMHHLGFIDPEDLNFVTGKTKYNSSTAYSCSKLAQLLFSHILQGKLPVEFGVNVINLHPGEVTTNVVRDLPPLVRSVYVTCCHAISFSASEGARSVVFCATDRQVYDYAQALKGVGSPASPFFSSDCKPGNIAKQALDMEMGLKLWEKTLELVNLNPEDIEMMLEQKGEASKTP